MRQKIQFLRTVVMATIKATNVVTAKTKLFLTHSTLKFFNFLNQSVILVISIPEFSKKKEVSLTRFQKNIINFMLVP